MKSSERGSILIFVAMTIAALMALGAFVADMGINWLVRGEAQNAADAGALAGAIALENDLTNNLTTTGPAYQNALAFANVGSSRVDLQACKLEYSIVSPK